MRRKGASLQIVTYAAAVFLSVSLLTPALALAQDERATVRVDGRAVFRVGAAANLSAAERARRVESRIQSILQNPQAAAQAQVEPSATDAAERIITVSGVPVVTVTESDAQVHLTTADALAAQWSQAIDAALERGRSRRASAWGRFSGEVQASAETAFSRLTESAITIIPRALAALLVLGLFWAVAAGVRWLMRVVFCRIVTDKTVESLIKQVAYYTVWALGLIVAADALGFEPQTVVTGLGLTGLALGFALKDIISNFVSGILILALRPFELGDQIVVGETEGGVERIELRATQIRTYDGRVVLVPNADVFTSRIINNTAHPVRRGSVELRLGYDQDLRRAVAVTREAAQKAEGVLSDPPASVRVREFGRDDITVEARFWTDSRRSDFLATTSNVRETVADALKTAGIGLPDPGLRVLVLRRAGEWRETLGRPGGVAGTHAGKQTGRATEPNRLPADGRGEYS